MTWIEILYNLGKMCIITNQNSSPSLRKKSARETLQLICVLFMISVSGDVDPGLCTDHMCVRVVVIPQDEFIRPGLTLGRKDLSVSGCWPTGPSITQWASMWSYKIINTIYFKLYFISNRIFSAGSVGELLTFASLKFSSPKLQKNTYLLLYL